MTDRDDDVLNSYAAVLDNVGDVLDNFAEVLNKAAERIGQVLSPEPPPLNRAQRRAQGKPRQGRRQRDLQASLRLVGKGRTGRPTNRR